MKRHTLHLIFATLVGFTLSSNGATLFTEDFSDNSASPNMTLGTGHGSPTTDFTGGNFTITSGTGSRIYLGTNNTDYSTIDFSFEADVTVPSAIFSNAWTMAFLGMGSPNADGGASGEPLTGSNIITVLRGDDGPGGNLKARDNDAGGGTNIHNNIGLTAGIHGMRMDWNATTMQATFMFDLGNDGYDPALTFVVNGADNGFTASNSQLFVGGGNGLTFDNINVTAVPEPSAALLGALGVLGLLRRRRI